MMGMVTLSTNNSTTTITCTTHPITHVHHLSTGQLWQKTVFGTHNFGLNKVCQNIPTITQDMAQEHITKRTIVHLGWTTMHTYAPKQKSYWDPAAIEYHSDVLSSKPPTWTENMDRKWGTMQIQQNAQQHCNNHRRTKRVIRGCKPWLILIIAIHWPTQPPSISSMTCVPIPTTSISTYIRTFLHCPTTCSLTYSL